MIKIGITGNIGSGKTTVAKLFQDLGVPVYYTEQEVHKIMDQPYIIDEYGKAFGLSIIVDGKIDRKKLGDIIFANKEARDIASKLVYPILREKFKQWCTKNEILGCKYCLTESAILYESGYDSFVDEVIVVTAPEEVRAIRVMERNKITLERFQLIESLQMPQEEKAKRGKYKIINYETNLKEIVDYLHYNIFNRD